MQNDHWKGYYQVTGSKPPSKLLVKALEYVTDKGKALDLGAGALVDSKFLLSEGYEVTAVDSSPTFIELTQEIKDSKFSFVQSTYDAFSYSLNSYDLITAQWALPFNSPGTFDMMFKNLKSSLKPEGIFTGQFFGIRDEWNVEGKDMTFHTQEEVHELLSDMHVIYIKEEEKDGTTARGNPKHWHVFHVIAKKVSND